MGNASCWAGTSERLPRKKYGSEDSDQTSLQHRSHDALPAALITLRFPTIDDTQKFSARAKCSAA